MYLLLPLAWNRQREQGLVLYSDSMISPHSPSHPISFDGYVLVGLLYIKNPLPKNHAWACPTKLQVLFSSRPTPSPNPSRFLPFHHSCQGKRWVRLTGPVHTTIFSVLFLLLRFFAFVLFFLPLWWSHAYILYESRCTDMTYWWEIAWHSSTWCDLVVWLQMSLFAFVSCKYW